MGRVKQYKELCGYDIYNYIRDLYKKSIKKLLEESSEELLEKLLEESSQDIKMISDFIINSAKDHIMYNKEFNTTSYNELIQQNNLEKYIKITNIDIVKLYNDKIKTLKNMQEIKNDINNYQQPLYHIIRTKPADDQELTIQNFKLIFSDIHCDYINHDGNSGIKDINEVLKKIPKKHTFIFIKEMLRCSKTLKKTYIGILYERYVENSDDSTIIQGLVGRDTGYDNNGISICYTNIESIVKYEKLWNSKFEDKTVMWNSKTTTNKNGVLSGKNTFNDPKEYDGFSETSDDSIEPALDKNEDKEYREFDTQEEAIKFGKEILKVNFHKRTKADAPKELITKDGNPSSDYLLKRMWGISTKNHARMVPTCNEKWCVYWRPSLINKF